MNVNIADKFETPNRIDKNFADNIGSSFGLLSVYIRKYSRSTNKEGFEEEKKR